MMLCFFALRERTSVISCRFHHGGQVRESKFIVLFLLVSLIVPFATAYSQQLPTKLLQGQITNTEDVASINVLNFSKKTGTITSETGTFEIEASLGDTLVFNGIRYETQSIVLSQDIYNRDVLEVQLRDNVNELETVRLGPHLTGRLEDDFDNVGAERPIDSYDVGLPGFKGERIEKEKPIIPSIGLGISIDVIAVYKHLSGYYKRKRTERKWITENRSVVAMINYFTPEFFLDAYQIPESKLELFLLACAETSNIESYFATDNLAACLKVFERVAADFNG